MKNETNAAESLQLASGTELPDPAPGRMWRLDAGALRIHNTHHNDASSLVCLALPGDLIGMEQFAGLTQMQWGYAITPCALTEVEVGHHDMAQYLKQSLLVARQRCSDMVTLRSDSIPQRVRYLLLLLAEHRDSAQCADALPSLRDMAMIVGSTVETMSRVLGRLRQFDVLHERKAQSGRVDVPSLRNVSFLPGMTSSSLLARERAMGVAC